MIAGILLAAGEARRFGSQKLLEPLDGTPMACRTAGVCLESRLDHVLVVTGPDGEVADAIRGRFPGSPRLSYAVNRAPERGLMSTLKTGLAAVTGIDVPGARVEAAMVIHADMPMVPPNLIDDLVIEYAWHGGIVIPECGGEWRHPRIIPRGLFDDFLALDDGEKGTTVIERYRADVTVFPVGDPVTFLDIDVPADIGRWHSAHEVEG